jgi:hypothetical protein
MGPLARGQLQSVLAGLQLTEVEVLQSRRSAARDTT